MKAEKVVWLLLLLSWSVTGSSAPEGHDVGSGGDSVLCRVQADSKYEGYYSLDYLLTIDDEAPLVEVESWQASIDRITKILEARSEYYADSFREFVSLLGNHQDYTKPRVWENSAFGLVAIDDQRIIGKIPSNCYREESNGKIDVIQSVIRQQHESTRIYSYDPKILDKLKKDRPLQFSMLMVHEWLWDFTDDVRAIRRVNHLLHSSAVEALDEDAFYRAIQGMGLTFAGSFVPVCRRTAGIRSAIEAYARQSCSTITEIVVPRTETAGRIFADNLNIQTIVPGDLSGLGAVSFVSIRLNTLRSFPEPMLDGDSNLGGLDLSDNQIEKIYRHTFRSTPHMMGITLAKNKLKSLPAGIFDGLPWLRRVNLADNELTDFPYEAFASHPGIKVYMGGNPIPSTKWMEISRKYPTIDWGRPH